MKLTIIIVIMKREIIYHHHTAIHVRKMGDGPIIILLHPSPLSGSIFTPFAALLASQFTVIMPDTPGYGYSDAPATLPQSIYDYVPYLHTIVTHYSTQPIQLYGTATGAQLAIAFALRHPTLIKHVHLDNAAHFTAEQRAAILPEYFISILPTANAQHLLSLWEMAARSLQYFPWYSTAAPDKLDEVSTFDCEKTASEAIQNIVTHHLLAGTTYAIAYQCAFAHEDAKYVQQLTVPTTIYNWLQSPIVKYVQQLLAYTFTNNITTVTTHTATRYQTMLTQMCKHLITT